MTSISSLGILQRRFPRIFTNLLWNQRYHYLAAASLVGDEFADIPRFLENNLSNQKLNIFLIHIWVGIILIFYRSKATV